MNRNMMEVLQKRAEENNLQHTDALDSSDNAHLIDDEFKSLFMPKKSFTIKELPVSKLKDFFTAKIGFRTYTDEELQELADSIEEEGLIDIVVVRPIPETDEYEILSGMHRTKAHRLKGWPRVLCRIVDVSDDRAVMIATEANLKRRQNLLPSERGFAYRAQLTVLKHQGKRIDLLTDETSVQIEQRLTSREQVAKLNGVDANEVFRLIRLTYLIPELLDMVDKKKLILSAGVKLSYYNEEIQNNIYAECFDEERVIHKITKTLAEKIYSDCPPAVGNYSKIRKIIMASPQSTVGSISLNKKAFRPYIVKIKSQKELEKLFLEFLEAHYGKEV